MLASPLSLQEREASADDHEFITLSEKTQCPVYLISEKVQGNLPCFSHTKESRVKTLFLTEKAFHQGHQTVLGKGESFFLSSESCSQFVYREFVNSHFLSSLQFCHLMDIPDASILKCFFSSRQFSMMSGLLSSRFFIPAVDAIQIQTMRMSLSLKFTNAK